MEWRYEYKRQKKYYYKNRRKCIERSLFWYKKNKNKVRNRNKKKIDYTPNDSKEYIKISERFKLEHPKFFESDNSKKNIRQKRYISRKRGAIGKHTLEEWKVLKEKHNYCCIKCSKKEPFLDQKYQWLTEDHIVPLSKGGTDYITNIQPMCHRCNVGKCNRLENKV